jgi:hypothetical protein
VLEGIVVVIWLLPSSMNLKLGLNVAPSLIFNPEFVRDSLTDKIHMEYALVNLEPAGSRAIPGSSSARRFA